MIELFKEMQTLLNDVRTIILPNSAKDNFAIVHKEIHEESKKLKKSIECLEKIPSSFNEDVNYHDDIKIVFNASITVLHAVINVIKHIDIMQSKIKKLEELSNVIDNKNLKDFCVKINDNFECRCNFLKQKLELFDKYRSQIDKLITDSITEKIASDIRAHLKDEKIQDISNHVEYVREKHKLINEFFANKCKDILSSKIEDKDQANSLLLDCNKGSFAEVLKISDIEKGEKGKKTTKINAILCNAAKTVFNFKKGLEEFSNKCDEIFNNDLSEISVFLEKSENIAGVVNDVSEFIKKANNFASSASNSASYLNIINDKDYNDLLKCLYCFSLNIQLCKDSYNNFKKDKADKEELLNNRIKSMDFISESLCDFIDKIHNVDFSKKANDIKKSCSCLNKDNFENQISIIESLFEGLFEDLKIYKSHFDQVQTIFPAIANANNILNTISNGCLFLDNNISENHINVIKNDINIILKESKIDEKFINKVEELFKFCNDNYPNNNVIEKLDNLIKCKDEIKESLNKICEPRIGELNENIAQKVKQLKDGLKIILNRLEFLSTQKRNIDVVINEITLQIKKTVNDVIDVSLSKFQCNIVAKSIFYTFFIIGLIFIFSSVCVLHSYIGSINAGFNSKIALTACLALFGMFFYSISLYKIDAIHSKKWMTNCVISCIVCLIALSFVLLIMCCVRVFASPSINGANNVVNEAVLSFFIIAFIVLLVIIIMIIDVMMNKFINAKTEIHDSKKPIGDLFYGSKIKGTLQSNLCKDKNANISEDDSRQLENGNGVNINPQQDNDSDKLTIVNTHFDKVETDKVETDEVETDEVETDEVETDEVETDEVETGYSYGSC